MRSNYIDLKDIISSFDYDAGAFTHATAVLNFYGIRVRKRLLLGESTSRLKFCRLIGSTEIFPP